MAGSQYIRYYNNLPNDPYYSGRSTRIDDSLTAISINWLIENYGGTGDYTLYPRYWYIPDGKIFKEWNESSDGTGIAYAVGATVPNDTDLYAIWEDSTIDYLTNSSELKSIADAIRTKGGTSSPLVYPTGYVSAIEAIPAGRVTQDAQGNVTLSDTGSIVAETPLSVTQNGTYTPNSGYAYSEVDVNVSGSGESIKTISGGGVSAPVAVSGWTVEDFASEDDTGAFGWIYFLSEKRRVSICNAVQWMNTGSFTATAGDTGDLITFVFDFATPSGSSSDIVSIVLTRIEINLEDITSEYASEVGNWQLFSFAYPSYS